MTLVLNARPGFAKSLAIVMATMKRLILRALSTCLHFCSLAIRQGQLFGMCLQRELWLAVLYFGEKKC